MPETGGDGKSVCSCGTSIGNGVTAIASALPITSLQAVQAIFNNSPQQLYQSPGGRLTTVVSQTLQALKTGYLYRYKKRLLNKDWRREYCVLLSDSSLVWFKGGDRRAPAGRLVLRDAPQLIAYGAYTNKVPLKPSKLPSGYNEDQLLVFGEIRRNRRGFVVIVHWFLTEEPNHTLDWINAIINTIPAPPPPPYSENDEIQRNHGYLNMNKLASDLTLMDIKESSIRNEKSVSRGRSSSKGASQEATACGDGTARSSSRKSRGVDAEEAAMNAALNSGTTTGWGRSPGWSVQGDPAQILCYYAAAEAAMVDLSASDLAFDIPADLGDLDIGGSMLGDFGDASAMDFGGFF
ncbi:uncharacterized protein LOC111266580 [Varroa jacobsoni]|uniref:PH domain-containing protein n=1 Tax=Varroa destructor TaxID=109461 RepID=A0A7M7JJC9_VARDE|nr:uncharacterized protein LOC111246920 [Varroa destructor]XP_022699903.1 uncharacterized protein LOC111266580 [Varroa jacobsoni]XP_022699904.1 uncharacterized protein LOC111266580 [Varroa jacobsoni]XP_022699906.1 uncharacterized protein LOC111266580 [Varroa jacobsoni]XP_022699907.1 uncharacterized protein LOC111266580 [Varroa jacobsoni]XP_022699908.1 uncharacterized protein LOC111266580 [Varroa jacobsoni]